MGLRKGSTALAVTGIVLLFVLAFLASLAVVTLVIWACWNHAVAPAFDLDQRLTFAQAFLLSFAALIVRDLIRK